MSNTDNSKLKMPHWSRYKFQNVEDVPASYLLWLYEKWGMKNSGELHRPLREYIERNMKSLKEKSNQ